MFDSFGMVWHWKCGPKLGWKAFKVGTFREEEDSSEEEKTKETVGQTVSTPCGQKEKTKVFLAKQNLTKKSSTLFRHLADCLDFWKKITKKRKIQNSRLPSWSDSEEDKYTHTHGTGRGWRWKSDKQLECTTKAKGLNSAGGKKRGKTTETEDWKKMSLKIFYTVSVCVGGCAGISVN